MVNNGTEVIHRQSVHVSARKSIDIRRVQLVRARERARGRALERAKDWKWIFEMQFSRQGNEARARVFFANTREFRILNEQGRSMEKRRRRKKEKQSWNISHLLSILVPFGRGWILRGCVIRVEFFERSESGEASKLKPKLSIPILEDNLTGLCAFVPNSRARKHTRDILPVNPMNRLKAVFFFFFFLMQAIFNS